MKKLTVFVFAGLVFSGGPAHAVSCEMTEVFKQVDIDAPGDRTPVWADKDGNLMFIERLHVNTDGTKRSYRVDDFWGESEALNNLCNAMSDACAGLGKAQLTARRIATEQAAKNGWPKDQLQKTRLSSQIIPMPGGKPCTPIDGFLVSATALHAKGIKDQCKLENYVDSLATPAIVIPKDRKGKPSEFSRRGVKVGDLVTAMPVDQPVIVHGVVGDTGPVNKLGEASIAMNGKLLQRTGLPENYQEVRGKGKYQGQGWSAPATFVLIYARSRDADDPYMTVARIEPLASDRFTIWGGSDRARACIDEYRTALKQTAAR